MKYLQVVKTGVEGDSSSVYNLINLLNKNNRSKNNTVYEIHDPRGFKAQPSAEFRNRSKLFYKAFVNPQKVDVVGSTNISYACIINGICYLAPNAGSNTHLGGGPTSVLYIRRFCGENGIKLQYFEGAIEEWKEKNIKKEDDKGVEFGKYQIDLEKKLTSINFENVIKYWDNSFDNKIGLVEFNFKTLEWIGYEQLTFLTSWIDRLIAYGKSVNIYLQSSAGVMATSETYIKRKKCLSLILNDWKLQSRIDKKVKFVSGEIDPFKSTLSKTLEVPFEYIPVINFNEKTFESDFRDLFSRSLRGFKEYSENIIGENTDLSYFDNHFLNYAIVKELYSNACQHGYIARGDENKCYISIYYNNKIEKEVSPNLLNKLLKERYKERPSEEYDYFLNKKDELTNNSFLEFTFLDFGEGISRTLEKKYLKENILNLKNKLSQNHDNQNLDSKVLEYAFLLFTSKYEFKEDLKIHDYVPRGLFIIKDIVKRYKGLLIARSKKGKVVFDFSKTNISDTVRFRDDDFSESIVEFPGTSITILLPTRVKEVQEQVDFKKATDAVPEVKFKTILQLYAECEEYPRGEDSKQNEVAFYERFFASLCVELAELNSTGGHYLLCLDFAGLSVEKRRFYFKLIYFLSYSPLINENVNVLFFNVLDKNIRNIQLDKETDCDSVGFYPHIIPIIHPDLTISWLGIKENYITENLSENWKGNVHGEVIDLENPEVVAGNVLKIYTSKEHSIVKCRIPEFQFIVDCLLNYQEDVVRREVNNIGILFRDLIYYDEFNTAIDHNYNIISRTDASGRAYLTSNGKYQLVFLSFIEKLYKKEYRRLISTFMVTNLFGNPRFSTKRIDKILTVTLSSQLLGKEVKDILEILNAGLTISLIPLSSYYDFHKEARFDEIQSNDGLLVVNDVISTGSLSKRIVDSVNKKRQGVSIFISSIVDTRKELELQSTSNYPIFSLLRFPIDKVNPESFDSQLEPIWINPIINAPVSMKSDRSNTKNVLLSPNDFLNEINDESLFSVGLFKKNTVYHTYYLETDKLFKGIVNGKYISLFSKLIKKLEQRRNDDESYNSNQRFTEFINEILSATHISQNVKDQLITELRKFKVQQKTEKFEINFVFYPFLSAVANLEDTVNDLLQIFRKERQIEIYPLPRIMTPKGWRFTFPPKFLNHITKGKNILLLDDGSCSGETLVQMIDMISFLEVKEIIVLSVFARLEDYNREFLTRINGIRAKNYQIPLKIYFGSHFNIPTYNKLNSPYFNEIEELSRYKVNSKSTAVNNYVRRRKDQIMDFINNEGNGNPIIPDFISKREMFRIRNIIGKYDSYRLFKEDVSNVVSTGNSSHSINTREYLLSLIDSSVEFNALVAVLIHEPKLIDTLNKIYPTLINKVKDKLDAEFSMTNYESNFLQKIFYFRILSFINIKILLNPDIMLRLFKTIDSSIDKVETENMVITLKETFDYYAFILYCISENKLINYENIDNEIIKNKLSFCLERMSSQTLTTDGKNYIFHNLMREFLDEYRNRVSSENQNEVISAFISFYNLYYGDLGKDSHPILYSRFQQFYVEYYNSGTIEGMSSIRTQYLEELVKIRDRIIPDAILVLESLKPFQSYINLDVEEHLIEIKSTISYLKDIIDSKNQVINNPEQKSPGYKFFEKLNNNIISYNSDFLNLIKDFHFDPFTLSSEIYKNSILKLESSMIKFEVEHLNSIGPLHVRSHPSFFEVIFKEIIQNAIKYAEPNSECKLLLSMEPAGFRIHYKQSSKKIHKMGERGIRGFKLIADSHSAKFEEFDYEKYEFAFHFPPNLINLTI
jgi:hypothetical protein